MGLSDIEAFFKRYKRKPLRAVLLLGALVVLVGVGAWLTSYFSEKGKQAAQPSVAKSGQALVAPVAKLPEERPAGGAQPEAQSNANEAKTANADLPTIHEKKATGLNIEQVTIGESDEHIRLDIAFRNPAGRSLLINEIQVSLDSEEWVNCSISINETFRIEELAAAQVSPGSQQVSGSFRAESDGEFRYPVAGVLLTSCGLYTLNLGLKTTLAVAADSIGVARVVLPKSMRVREHRVQSKTQDLKAGQTKNLRLPSPGKLHVRMATSDGQEAVREMTLLSDRPRLIRSRRWRRP